MPGNAGQLQLRSGTTAEHSSFTGAAYEPTVDTTKKTIVIHDGSTVGGHPLQKEITAGTGLFFQGTILNMSGSVGGGAPTDATYVVLSNNGSLSNERVLAVGTGLSLTDAGANSTVTINFDTGTLIGIDHSALGGLSDADHVSSSISLGAQTLVGRTAQGAGAGSDISLVLGTGIAIFTGVNSFVIGLSGSYLNSTYAPIGSRYLVATSDPTLTADRAITMGTGLNAVDGGNNSTYTINFSTGILSSYLRGSSLRSFLTGGSGMFLEFGANGVTFHASGGSAGAPASMSYITINSEAELSAERSLAAGTGISIIDGGSNSTVTLGIATGIFHEYVRGQSLPSFFTGGSGMYLEFGTGGVTFHNSGSDLPTAPYVTIGNSSLLSSERALTAGTGIAVIDGGANSTVTLGFETGILSDRLRTTNYKDYVVPYYAQPVSFNNIIASAVAANTTIIINLGSTTVHHRNLCEDGTSLVITTLSLRYGAGSTAGTYTGIIGIRQYAAPNTATINRDYLLLSGFTTASNYCHAQTGCPTFSYYNPIIKLDGPLTGGWNMIFRNGPSAGAMANSGITIAAAGYYVPTSMYP